MTERSQGLKILLATDNKDLDEYIKKSAASDGKANITVDEIYYRGALVDSLRQNKYDVVVLSAFLSGEEDMMDIVFQLRMADARVIMLMGDNGKKDPKVFDLIAMGVYDILFSPISVKQIEEAIKSPKKFSDILKELNIPWRPESKNLIAKFKDLIQRKQDLGTELEASKGEGCPVQIEQIKKEEGSSAENPKAEDWESAKAAADKPALSFGFFDRISGAKEKAAKKETKSSKSDENEYKARSAAVIGAEENVGSTAFAIALAKLMEHSGEKVRIVDAGGGAKEWLSSDAVECSDKVGLLPGYVTIFDVGCDIQSKAMPLAQYVFIVADSRAQSNPNLIMPYAGANTYLIGNKGMDEDILFALADLKMVKPLFSLPEDVELITAEQKGVGIIPKKWRRKLEKACKIIK